MFNNYLALISVAFLCGAGPAAQAQVVIFTGFDHTFDTSTGAPLGSTLGQVSNFTIAYEDVGLGGSQAVVADFDFNPSGLVNFTFLYPTVSGNTSANLNDYAFSFDVKLNVDHGGFGVSLSTAPGIFGPFTGDLDSASDFQITTADTFEHFALNLGSDFVSVAGNLNPRVALWNFFFQFNSNYFTTPSTGNQIILSNFQLTMVPEPSVLALFGLGAVAGLSFLRRSRG